MSPVFRAARAAAAVAVPIALAVFLAGCGSDRSGSPPEEAPPPPDASVPQGANILLLSIDTLRADHLGAYGYERSTSPHIDAFAAESILFRDAVSQSPSTAPSHMTIFTGLTPPVHRIENSYGTKRRTRLAEHIPLLTETLLEHGYLTAGLHGGGNVDAILGFSKGFHLYSQDLISYNWANAYFDPDDLEAVRSWIRLAQKRRKPFFLFLHHYVCHAPYVSAPEAHLRRFLQGHEAEGLPPGIPDAKKSKVVNEISRIHESRKKIILLGKMFELQIRNFWDGVDLSNPRHREHIVAMYDAGVYYSDFLFHAVMEILRQEGVYDDTIIVLLSDHGEEFFEHGGREHGRLFVEHLHVPLAIRFPSSAGLEPRTVERTVRLMDVLPSVFDQLSIPVEHPIQGVSFMPLITGAGTYDPPIASYGEGWVRLATEELTYTNQSFGGVTQWLFDKRADPQERDNLAQQRSGAADELRERALGIFEQDQAFGARLEQEVSHRRTAVDERLVEQLRALGYMK